MRQPPERDDFVGRQRPCRFRRLRQVCHAARQRLARPIGDGTVEQRARARGERQQPRGDAQQRGLAGAVRTDDAGDRTGCEVRADAIERQAAIEAHTRLAKGKRVHRSTLNFAISQKKNGAPRSAVNTPSKSSPPENGESKRTPMSAAATSAAPASADGRISRPGAWP